MYIVRYRAYVCTICTTERVLNHLLHVLFAECLARHLIMTILSSKGNLMRCCIPILTPNQPRQLITVMVIRGPDWLEYTSDLADCETLHGIPYAITAQGRLRELC